MTSDDADLNNLRNSLDVLESASLVSKRSRTTNIGPYVEEIAEYGYQTGFRSSELERLLNVLSVKNELDQTSSTTLLRNLYPAERVPLNILLKAVNSLGKSQKKPAPAIQAGIVKWIAAVNEFLMEPDLLVQLYSVFFNLLDITTLRTPLCQLLALITRRRHVRPHRIQRLLELCQQFGGEPPLTGLLRVYKNFCPDIIVGSSFSGRALSLTKFDVEWRNRLLAIQEAASQAEGVRPEGFSGGFKVARSGLTKKRGELIPEVHTFRADEIVVTLEEVNSVQSFVENLSKIEPPSQIVAALKDPLLQKFMMLKVSPDSEKRLEFWLERYFEDEMDLIEQGFGLSPSLTDVLRSLATYTEATRELHPTVEKFLMVYLPMWNGVSDTGPILDLISYIKPGDFKEMNKSILYPLEQAILGGAHSPFETLFGFYSMLAPRWLNVFATISSNQNILSLRNSVQSLFDHVSTLGLSALVASPNSSSNIAGYFSTLAQASLSLLSSMKPAISIPIGLPPPQLFYLILFSPSLEGLSTILSALSTFKAVVERSIKTPLPSSSRNSQLANIISVSNDSALSSLNAYLLDTANLLWRSRALAPDPPANTACMVPEATRKQLMAYLPELHRHYSLPLLFGLTGHVLISGAAYAAWRELEDELLNAEDRMFVDSDQLEQQMRHKGPVSQRSLAALGTDGGVVADWREVRERVVKYLEARGVEGVENFRRAAMGNR